MGKCKGEYWVVDNAGFTDGPFETKAEAVKRIKENSNNYDINFSYAGNCCVVLIVGTYDNYLVGDTKYVTKRGLPKSCT